MREEDADRPRARPVSHEIGSDLSTVSLDELGERVALLEREIARLREEEGRKRASLERAGASFRS